MKSRKRTGIKLAVFYLQIYDLIKQYSNHYFRNYLYTVRRCPTFPVEYAAPFCFFCASIQSCRAQAELFIPEIPQGLRRLLRESTSNAKKVFISFRFANCINGFHFFARFPRICGNGVGAAKEPFGHTTIFYGSFIIFQHATRFMFFLSELLLFFLVRTLYVYIVLNFELMWRLLPQTAKGSFILNFCI